MKVTTKYTQGIGERIRFVRKRAGLDQFKFAELLDVSRQSVSGYETERLMPSGKIIELISDQYQVNPWWIRYGVGEAEAGFEETASGRKMTLRFPRTEELTPVQHSLIEYIKSNKEAANQLARLLWNKALGDF